MNQGFNVVYASQIPGVALDCDLMAGTKIGGGTATDNTAAFNSLLATASATNPIKLIIDGSSLVSGIVLPSTGYVCLEGIDRFNSGFYQKSASNADVIQNGIPYINIGGFTPTGTAPALGGPVEIRNLFINGNRGNGTNGNSNSGDPRGIPSTYWFANICLYGVNGLVIENVYSYDSSAYSFRLINCANGGIRNNIIFNPNVTPGLNQDCIHMCKPFTDFTIHGNLMYNNNSDDGVAINAPEGYSSGTMDRIVVHSNTYTGVLHAIRIYGANDGDVGTVNFSNNTGLASTAVIWVGVGTAGTGDIGARVIIGSNNVFQMTSVGSWLDLTSNVGDITLSNCVWLSPVATGNFVAGSPGTASSITLNNCQIYRTIAGNNTSTNFAAGSSYTISKFTMNNCQVVNEQGHAYAAIPQMLAMSGWVITQLVVNDLDMTNATLFADGYTNIGSFIGNGLGSQTSSKTAAYTVLPTDGTIFVNSTTAAFNLTAPAKLYAGHTVQVVKTDSSANAVTRVGTFSGVANPTLASQYSKARWTTDGTTLFDV